MSEARNKVYQAMLDIQQELGMPPTMREIAGRAGIARGTAYFLVQMLVLDGKVEELPIMQRKWRAVPLDPSKERQPAEGEPGE